MKIDWNTLIAAVEFMNVSGKSEFKDPAFTIKKKGKTITITYHEN